MKRIYVLLIVLPVLISMNGQTSKSIELSYCDSDFSFIEDEGKLYILAPALNAYFMDDPSLPALPFIDVQVLVAKDAVYQGHTSSFDEILLKDDVVVSENTSYTPTNKIVYEQERKEATYTDSIYPSIPVQYTGTHEVGGYRLIGFSVCPFKYDAVNKKLYLRKNISLNIDLSTTSKYWHYESNHAELRHFIERYASNGSELQSLYSFPKKSINRRSNQMPGCDYLIITCDSLRQAFQRLADWKTTKGILTKIITVEEIYADTIWNTPQLKIKNAIYDYFVQSGYNLQYVLLAGDNNIVPAELCHVRARSKKDGWIEREAPCDLFYASFSNMDWDTNRDGKIGASDDSIDLSYDIIVTRLSACNSSDAEMQVERIINYEKNPSPGNNWQPRILMGGTKLFERYTYDGVYMSDTHYKGENCLYRNYIYGQNPNIERYMLYDTGSSFDGGSDYDFSVANQQEQFSTGYTFINTITHGGPYCWKAEYQYGTPVYYECSDAESLHNSGPTIITTSACLTNDFCSDSVCLSETFMRNPNSGIIAYYGCSKEGWASPSQFEENPSDMFNGKFYRELLSRGHQQMGRAVYDSKQMHIGISSYADNTYRWLMIALNVLCDPEMPVFIDTPKKFDNVLINFTDSILSFNTNVQNCRVCVTSKDDYGENFYFKMDSVDHDSLILAPGAYTLCITKPGYIPYIAYVGDSICFQNEVFRSDALIVANDIAIGENVTASKPEGPVIVEQGKLSIRPKHSIMISGGFVLNPPAEFEILTTQ